MKAPASCGSTARYSLVSCLGLEDGDLRVRLLLSAEALSPALGRQISVIEAFLTVQHYSVDSVIKPIIQSLFQFLDTG